MHWNNRIFKHQQGDQIWYSIHETFYDEDGKVELWTQEEISPYGETVDELIEHVEQLLNDIKKSKEDIIEYK